MSIFAGTAISLVDKDRRCAFPKCFRKALDSTVDGEDFLIAPLNDKDGKYLKLYTETEWKRFEDNVRRMADEARMDFDNPSSTKALMIEKQVAEVKGRGCMAALDKNNRITLTDYLLEWIGLDKKGEIVFMASTGKTLRLIAKADYQDPTSIDPEDLIDVSRFMG